MVRIDGAHELADRLERAIGDEVKLLALTIEERSVILNTLDDPPEPVSTRDRRAGRPASPRGRAYAGGSCLLVSARQS